MKLILSVAVIINFLGQQKVVVSNAGGKYCTDYWNEEKNVPDIHPDSSLAPS